LPPISRPLMFMRLFALNSISYLIWIWQMLGTGADAHLLPFSYPDPSSTASSPVHLTVVTGRRLKSRRKVGAKPFLLSPLSQAMSVETAGPSQIPLSTVILVPGSTHNRLLYDHFLPSSPCMKWCPGVANLLTGSTLYS
jgi:hypothetical protein